MIVAPLTERAAPPKFGTARLPVTSVPMKLPSITLGALLANVPIAIPPTFPEIRLRSAAVVPPMRSFSPMIKLPSVLGSAIVPVGSVPIKHPTRTLLLPSHDDAGADIRAAAE